MTSTDNRSSADRSSESRVANKSSGNRSSDNRSSENRSMQRRGRREQDLFDPWFRPLELFRNNFFENWPETFNQLPSMSTDIVEKNNSYLISCDLPGVDKKDIKITLKKNILEITGERKEIRDENADDHTFHRKERYYGNFVRQLVLPDDVAKDLSGIKAKAENGVLTLVIPKDQSLDQEHNIDIE